MNETMTKFGYPQTLIHEYEHWCVLLRPKQVTLGSLVLAARSEATRFSDLSPASIAEQHQAVADIERVLGEWVQYEKINYLMLMMVDPHVHYHVIPRYSVPRSFADIEFADAGWPALPALGDPIAMTPAQNEALITDLRARW
ncbi:MAG: HIT family protein [Pseudomonadota bacterium]